MRARKKKDTKARSVVLHYATSGEIKNREKDHALQSPILRSRIRGAASVAIPTCTANVPFFSSSEACCAEIDGAFAAPCAGPEVDWQAVQLSVHCTATSHSW